MLANADLARYAGQLVWLELSFDRPENQPFISKFQASATPTFFIVDSEEKVVASQTGAMSLLQLRQFLDRGIHDAASKESPAELALKRGDALFGPKPAEAAEAYREALKVAPREWPESELAQSSLAVALEQAQKWQECAEVAADETARMRRDTQFSRTVVAGMWCLVQGDPASWSTSMAKKLEPLAKEALSLPTTIRDQRDELYRTLMYLALSRNDKSQAGEWGDKWLAELDAIEPRDDEGRSAVDIARVEAIQTYGDPERILPALRASERIMPGNYNASLRVAQMESAAKHYDEAIGACERGLSRTPGAAGESWLLQVKAAALTGKGRTAEAHQALENALRAAQAIPTERSRNNTIKRIKQALESAEFKSP